MNRLEMTRSDVLVSDITSSATHSHTIDTIGFGYAAIDVSFEPITAAAGTTAVMLNVLTLTQSDTSGGTYAAVTGFVAGTDWTVPYAVGTGVSGTVRFNVNLEGKKRFLKLSVTPKVDQALVTNVSLGVAEASPTNATLANTTIFVSG